jgi:3-oxoacyl-[acyl-carrier-protein] synthase-3
MLSPVYIKGLGYYVPERIMDNFELSTLVDTSDEWIRTRTGIHERHLIAPGQTCSDLVCAAAQKALHASGTKPEEITHLITATASGDAYFPATAAKAQQKIGLGRCMSFDISAACSGFVYGLKIAQGLIAVEPEAKVLLTAAEILSNRMNWQDRSTCVLFGDGAGAAVLSADAAPPSTGTSLMANAVIEGVLCDADGSLHELLFCKGGCSDHPYKMGDLVGPEHFIFMQGREIFKHAVRSMATVCKALMGKLGYSIDDFDLVIPHQANLRIIQAVGERLKAPEKKVFVNVHKYGNTSAASIPLALGEALEQGIIKPGMRVLCATFGAGLTWGAAALKF